MINNILFDLDGTIINSEAGVTGSIRYALKECGYGEPPQEELKKCIGPPLTGSFRERFFVPEADVARVLKTFRRRYRERGMYECELYPGIVSCLKRARALEYGVNLASSKNEQACRSILSHFQITELFDEIVGSTESASIEAKKDVIEEYFRRAPGKSLRETVLVGDTHFDAEGALLAGIECLGVTYGFGKAEELQKYGVTRLFSSAQELEVYFEQLKKQ